MSLFLSGLLRECPETKVNDPKLKMFSMNALSDEILLRKENPILSDFGQNPDYFGLCNFSSLGEYSNATILLLTAFMLRAFLSVITFGLRVPGDAFLPSMVAGATIGRLIGILVKIIADGNPRTSDIIITPAAYALVGAASFLTGVTRLTLAVVVIMFEITGGGALTFVVPLCVASVTAKSIAEYLDKNNVGGISDVYIKFHCYPFLNPDKELDYYTSDTSLIASDIMVPITNLIVIPVFDSPNYSSSVTGMKTFKPYPHSINTLSKLLKETDHQGYPVVDNMESMVFVGYVKRVDLMGTQSFIYIRINR
jgi:chloride channel 3/4/5